MSKAQSMQRYCGADKGYGRGLCKRAAGWGTPYNTGPCVNHGGALPNVRKHHARLAALQFVEGQMGAEVDVDPIEAPIIALRLAGGIVQAWRTRIHENEGKSTAEMDEGLRLANMDFARIAKMANDAGVAERQTRMMERAAEQLSLLFEELVAAAQATRVQREAMLEAWVKGLARLEAPAIDGTAEEIAA